MTAQYSFPTTNLAGEADGSLLAGLQYGCLTCATTCNSADVFKLHVDGSKHRKKLEAASLSESADIATEIAGYKDLETPHREANKAKKQEKFEELKQQKESEQESMTPQEKAKAQRERDAKKRAREAEKGAKATPPPAKKAKVAAAGMALYTCTICNTNLNSEAQMQQHVQSPKHIAKAGAAPPAAAKGGKKPKTAAVAGNAASGCAACGLPGPINQNHFESKAHRRNVGGA